MMELKFIQFQSDLSWANQDSILRLKAESACSLPLVIVKFWQTVS